MLTNHETYNKNNYYTVIITVFTVDALVTS